jgi:hypothetical protein
MENYAELDFNRIKFKKPVKYSNGYYIGITDIINEGIIIESPKLKICYSCNTRALSGTNNRKTSSNNYYNYSVTVPEDFANFLSQFEDVCITHLKKIKHMLILNSTNSPPNFVFNSAVIPNEESDPIFKIKLITDKDGNIITMISMNNGTPGDIAYLKTDNSVVQYIECSGISITNEGQVYPIWIAHQIVIIPYSKIYKKKMLLDVLREKHPDLYSCTPAPTRIAGIGTGMSPGIGTGITYENPMRRIKQDTEDNKIMNIPPRNAFISLDPNMLQNMKSKLKPRQ